MDTCLLAILKQFIKRKANKEWKSLIINKSKQMIEIYFISMLIF